MDKQQIFVLEQSITNLQILLKKQNIPIPPEIVPPQLVLLDVPDFILEKIEYLPQIEKYELAGATFVLNTQLLGGDVVYSGQWKNNWRNGRGQQYNKIEEKYQMGYWNEGEFVYGHIISKEWIFTGVAKHLNFVEGKIICIDKSAYKGKFQNNLYHDDDAEFINEDYKYIGSFKMGKKYGKGVLKTAEFVYEGEFDNDEMTGKGKKKIISNGYEYEGDFVNGQLSGMGILRRKQDDYYKGEFLNGKRHGFGEMKRGGQTFTGNFLNDVLHGWVMVTKEKREYKCYFDQGVEDKSKSELMK